MNFNIPKGNRRERKMNFRSDKYITVDDIYIQVG